MDSMRVLMQVPDLSAGPAPTKTKQPEVETFVQQPLAPLATAAQAPDSPQKTKAPVKPLLAESRGVTPDELKAPSKFTRPLTVLVILAVAAALGIALSDRQKTDDAPSTENQLLAPVVEQPVPGGSPTTITQIPEISFPVAPVVPPAPAIPPAPTPPPEQVAPVAPVPPDTMKIERLPSVNAGAAQDGATAQVSDASPAANGGPQPIVAQLESRIEQPKSR
jgi:hypothetical protein